MNHIDVFWWRSCSVALLGAMILSGCSGKANSTGTTADTTTDMTVPKLISISEQHLESLSKKKVFFGHQSVGFNIMRGVGDVSKEYPAVTLRVTDTAEPALFDAPVLAHTTVGQNSDPESKMKDFAEHLRGGIGGRADIAAFKFCYADFESSTDASRVFAMYKRTMTDLAAAYPETRFVHITVPLKATSSGLKKYIKNVLGKPHPFIADNSRRNEFNELMRKEYTGKQLFDLAAIEATRMDGTASFDTANGTKVPSLANEYTSDSGHLNEQGRRFVAEQFIGVLGSL